MKLIYLICFIFCLTSCAELHKNSQLKSIDSLEKSIDSVSTVIDQFPIGKVEELKNEYFNLENELRIYKSNTDSIEISLAEKFDQLKIAKALFDVSKNKNKAIQENLKYCKQNLKNLKQDIENGNGERENYSKHLDLETKKVKKLTQLSKEYIQNFQTITKNCYSNFGDLRDHINLLKSKS